jgi:hypothetical protein
MSPGEKNYFLPAIGTTLKDATTTLSNYQVLTHRYRTMYFDIDEWNPDFYNAFKAWLKKK